MKLNRVSSALIFILMGIFTCILLYDVFRDATRAKIIGWIILFVVLVILGLLGAKFRAVTRYLNLALETYLRFTFWALLFFAPVLPFRFLYDVVSTRVPPWLQVLILTLWGACLVAAIWVLVLEKNRIRLFDWLRERVGLLAPLAYSFNLMWIAVIFFSSVTYTLVHSGVLRWSGPASQTLTPGAIMDFYFWNFLDAVPVFKITDTLLWKEPLTYDNSWIGFLLLLFKISVISPIIGAFIWYWRYIGKENSKKQVRKRVPRTETACFATSVPLGKNTPRRCTDAGRWTLSRK